MAFRDKATVKSAWVWVEVNAAPCEEPKLVQTVVSGVLRTHNVCVISGAL